MGMMFPSFLQDALRGQSAGAAPPAPQPAGQPAVQQPPTSGLDLNALSRQTPQPRDLVRQAAGSNGWQLDESGDRWQIVVSVGPLRKQTIEVRFDRRDNAGSSVIHFRTPCARATEEHAMTFLRYNAQMIHGAFAVESTPNGEMIVIEANQLADTADPLEITRTVSAIAWQADQVEARMMEEDRL
jgi:hypothetical protein